MSVKDVKPDNRIAVAPIEGMRTIVDSRTAMAPDHLVDTIARGYALELISGMELTIPVTRKVSTHLTKVTYG